MAAGNWSLVGYGSDPIPDDPATVAAQIDHIRAVAADIATQVDRLPTDGAVDQVPWDSEAAPRFKEVVKKLPKDLRRLHLRYSRVAEVLGGFHAVLVRSKAQAQANLAKAVAAHHDIEVAQAGVAQMAEHAAQAAAAAAAANAANARAAAAAHSAAGAHGAGAPGPAAAPVQPEPWTGPDYHAQLAAARAAFESAKAEIATAVSQFHQASQDAAHGVSAASHDGLKNDTSLWGSIVHGVESAAHWVATHVPLRAISGILTKISAVAGILSFIPVIGEVAGVVALATAGLALAADAISTLNDAYEGRSLGGDAITLGLDALAVVSGGAAVKLGGMARTAATTARVATEAADSADAAAAAATATREATAVTAASDAQRLERLTTGNPLKVWGARVVGVTDRAETNLARSEADLEAAAAAERRYQAAAAAAHTSASAAAASAKSLQTAANLANVAGGATGLGGEANSAVQEEPAASNPASAVVRSFRTEVGGVMSWSDDPVDAAAQSIGAHIPAEPIPAAG